MSIGDYVPCPRCRDGYMFYGSSCCDRCHLKNLHQVVDEVLGEERPRKNVKSTSELADEFDEFFNSHNYPSEVYPKVPSPKRKETVHIKLPPKIQKRKTLVVNIFAGPGAGKSTMAYGLMYDLKNLGINAEFAEEYAKSLVFEKRNFTFEDQVYLFAKQHHKIFDFLDQTDVVVTDCPLLLSPVYDGHKRLELERLVVKEHNKMWNYNVFVKRLKRFNPLGRLHNEAQAKEIDQKVLDVLDRNGQCYEVFEGNPKGKDAVLRKILRLLDWHTKANIQEE